MMTDADKLFKLKEILLTEDRDFAKQILQKLDMLEDTVYVENNLSDKIGPIIDKKITNYSVELDQRMGPIVAESLSSEIKNSQDKIVDILFPIIGKMIKKFVQQEMKTLSDNINAQLSETFSVKKYSRKIKSMFTGVSEPNIILAEISKPELQQIFVIEKGSGLILASYSKTQTIDADMIAGMLTAIKSFVEDAFSAGNQNLENIEYELYTIQIQNFSSYYMAAVMSGSINNFFKSKTQDNMFAFADTYLKDHLHNHELLTENLKMHFENE